MAVVRIELTPSQHAVYNALRRDAEQSNEAVADAAGLSRGWTSEVLRALERMGLARHRIAKSQSRTWVRYKLWKRA